MKRLIGIAVLLAGMFSLLGTPMSHAASAPTKDAELQECEPIRREILRINQKPYWLRSLYQPRLAHLKKRYGRCFQAIQTEEFDYLKQAEIPNHPGPKLPTLPEKTGRKHWWWPWS